MYHKYKSLLQNMPTRHLLTKTLRDRAKLSEQLDKLVHVDIVNFFVAGSSKQITEVLMQASNPNAKDGPYFSDEFAWYSMSLVRNKYKTHRRVRYECDAKVNSFLKVPGDSKLPECTNCQTNVTLVHLIPEPFGETNKRKNALASTINVDDLTLTEMFYFDLAVDAIMAVA